MTCSKDRRPPFRRPRIEQANPARLERAASGVADLRSVPLSYGFSDGRCESRTRRSFGSDSFRDCLACPRPTFQRVMHQEGLEPPCSRGATALQAACQADSASDA